MFQLLLRFVLNPRLIGLTTLFFGCTLISVRAQTPFFGSVVPVGNTQSKGESYVNDVATDAQGNTYVLGSFIANLDFGSYRLSLPGAGRGPFIAKFGAAGNFLWAASGGYVTLGGIGVDSDGNVYITGAYTFATQLGPFSLPDPMDKQNGDVFVAKLDAAGNWLWVTHGGGPGKDRGTNLAVDAAGIVTVVGAMGSATATVSPTQLTFASPDPSAYYGNTFVARLSPDGKWLGVTVMTTAETYVNPNVALDATGNAYVGGTYSSASLRLGGTTLLNTTPGTQATYIAKITPAGSWQWATGIIGTGGGTQVATGVAVDQNGITYLTGNFSSSTATFGATTLTNQGVGSTDDLFVASLDANGAWRWASQASGPGNDISSDLVLDRAGQPIITGEFVGKTVQFGTTLLTNTSSADKTDAFVAKLDAAGAWTWALSTNGTEEEYGQSIAMAPDGAACIVGNYWGQPTFGNSSVAGNYVFPNVYLAKVYDNGPLAEVAALAPSSGGPGQVITLTGSGFVGVTAVAFNGTPAAAFTVQSASHLEATVPAGVTAGPVSVRTSAGMSFSALPFQPLALASAPSAGAANLWVWPNPVGTGATLQLQLPATIALTGPTRAELRNSLGQVVRQSQFGGRATDFPINNLAPGMYQLALFPAGQPALLRRVAVSN